MSNRPCSPTNRTSGFQWKGTEVCADIHCRCGAFLHYDGDFFYFFTCGHCGQAWEIGTHVAMYPVSADDLGTGPNRVDLSHYPTLRDE